MFRPFVAAALTAALCACVPQPPVNPNSPQVADVCQGALASGASDPQPRDVHMLVAADKKALAIYFCIVSNSATSYAQFSATVSVFNNGGEYLASSDGGVGYTKPVTDNSPGTPAVKAIVPVAIAIDPKYVDQGISKSLMIRLYSYPCATGTDTGSTCTAVPTGKTETFMRDLAP